MFRRNWYTNCFGVQPICDQGPTSSVIYSDWSKNKCFNKDELSTAGEYYMEDNVFTGVCDTVYYPHGNLHCPTFRSGR